MAHADRGLASIAATLGADLEWVGKGATISIYRRKDSPITGILFEKFKMMGLAIHPSVHELPPQIEGVLVEKKDNNSFELKLMERTSGIPFKLHHHPVEVQMETLQKLRQLFGLREDKATRVRQFKQVNIFDGLHWVPIPEKELKLVSEHLLSRDEIARFQMGETIETISPKLKTLAVEVMSGIRSANTPEEVSYHLAPLLEFYLNGFNAEIIAKKNILRMTGRLQQPDIAEQVQQLDTFEKLIHFMQSMIDNIYRMPKSEGRDHILGIFSSFYNNLN